MLITSRCCETDRAASASQTNCSRCWSKRWWAVSWSICFATPAECGAKPSAAADGIGLSVAESRGGSCRLSDVSLTLHAGEIVGIYGLLGAGRSELLLHLFGAWGERRKAGSVQLRDRHTPDGPADSDCGGPADGQRRSPSLWPGDG